MSEENIKTIVKENYGKIAAGVKSSCCEPSVSSCGTKTAAESVSAAIGYTQDEMQSVPEGANLGLGCGNPTALAELKEGETVLDLGSGAGFDCFLAAQKVGTTGKIIGIDMTPEMIAKAIRNALNGNYSNVEFHLGEIEHLPLPDASVDAVISNCVINLSPDKESVFKEVHRVLKSGGRMMISDIVLTQPLPDSVMKSVEAYTGCVAGAMLKDDYLALIRSAGFSDVSIVDETVFSLDWILSDPSAQTLIQGLNFSGDELSRIASTVYSIKVKALKT